MFVSLWKFRAVPGREADFEAAYGAFGTWAVFFTQGSGYKGTDLLRSPDGSYLTVDCWETAEDWENFRRVFAEGYETLDRRCGELTLSEEHIGEFLDISEDYDTVHD